MRVNPRTWARVLGCDRQGVARIDPRHIYILPTRYGLMFAALVGGMLLGALNYANNPGLLLTFLLAALGGNAIYLTWRNLRGLELVRQRNEAIFLGEQAGFCWLVRPGLRSERPAIQIEFRAADGDVAVVDLSDMVAAKTTLTQPGRHRGWQSAPPVTISTRYPFGLLRAWCYIDPDSRVLVYPQPVWRTWRGLGGMPSDDPDSGANLRSGGDGDFDQLRPYRDGDSLRHVHWKAVARSQRLVTKEFSDGTAQPIWLDFDRLRGHDVELRLSILCGAVLEADRQGATYGLRLGTLELGPARGGIHREQCLRALALYGSGE